MLARGIAILCILPPLEGWDEYQHLAYIQYVLEHKSPPVFSQATVSRQLLAKVTEFPQPDLMLAFTENTGAVNYATFFHAKQPPTYQRNHADIPLYQAQHGSLYYFLMTPVWKASGGIEQFIDAITVLRLINVVFTIVSLMGCCWLLSRLVVQKTHALLMMLLIACQPLYLLNGCRVANDALAITCGTLVVLWGLQSHLHKKYLLILPIGCCLGLGMWAKSTIVALLPFVVLCMMMSVVQRKISMKQGLLIGSGVIGVALLTCGPQLYFNWQHYHTLFPMQEAFINAERDHTLSSLLRLGLSMNLPKRLLVSWHNSTWIGGWSFLWLDRVSRYSVSALLTLALAGWSWSFLRKSARQPVFHEPYLALRCVFLIGCVSLGLGWHMIQSYAAWGESATSPSYAAVAFPFLLILTYAGATQFSNRIAMAWGRLMALLYFGAEWYNVLGQMIPFYSGGDTGGPALARLARIHPSWLGTLTFGIAAVLAGGLWLALMDHAGRQARYERRQEESAKSL